MKNVVADPFDWVRPFHGRSGSQSPTRAPAEERAVKAGALRAPRAAGRSPACEPGAGVLERGGFSLVEVMVAILILGVTLAGLTHGITTALESSKESELQATAALFAAGQIETLRAEGGLENGETEGDCGPGLETYQWKQTISDAGIDGLHDVDVVIESARDGQEIYELKTQLFEPASAATGQNDQSRKKARNSQ